MIKTPSSTVIGGAGIWTPGCTVIRSTQKTLDQLIKSLFSNNEVGFAYDPNDLTTLYQDAAGTIPVTAAGQPIGLVLDKSRGVLRSAELIKSGWTASSGTINNNNGVITFTSTAVAAYIENDMQVEAGKWYEVSFTVSNFSTGGVSVSTPAIQTLPVAQANATYKQIFSPTGLGKLKFVTRFGMTSLTLSNVSIKEIHGNHAYQNTSSMRPLLVANPQRLDYDTVDDKLITTFPAQLTGCTVIRSVPNVGTQILTNQTIPTPYNDNIDHCGLIVINRALTASETSQITKLFNKAAGV